MSFWILFFLSFLPGIFWLWFFTREDAARPEPKRTLFSLFARGVLAVIPVFILEYPWTRFFGEARFLSLARLAVFSFFLIGGVEEGTKAFFLFPTRRWPEFDEALDGIIYGITLGLGFAAGENLLYTLWRGPLVGMLRAAITPLAHASFTGWLGYFMGRRRPNIVGGLLLAVFLHGAYDFSLLAGLKGGELLAVGVVGGAVGLLYQKIRQLAVLPPWT